MGNSIVYKTRRESLRCKSCATAEHDKWSSCFRYTHKGFFIGHWMDNDAGDLWISLKHWFTDTISGSISYEMERHGGTDVTEGSDME